MLSLHHLLFDVLWPFLYLIFSLQWGYNDSRMDITVTIAKLLIKYGCNPKAKSTKRQTAIMLALAKVRFFDLIVYKSFLLIFIFS